MDRRLELFEILADAAEGQAAGEDDKILEALAASVERLKGKIAEAEAELTAAEDA